MALRGGTFTWSGLLTALIARHVTCYITPRNLLCLTSIFTLIYLQVNMSCKLNKTLINFTQNNHVIFLFKFWMNLLTNNCFKTQSYFCLWIVIKQSTVSAFQTTLINPIMPRRQMKKTTADSGRFSNNLSLL